MPADTLERPQSAIKISDTQLIRTAQEIVDAPVVNQKVLKNPQEVINAAQSTMPGHYANFSVINHGTQRAIVKAEWGPAKVPRSLKVDMLDPNADSKTVHKHRKGYGTIHEFNILQGLPDAWQHGLDAPLEIFGDQNQGTLIAAHNFIEGESLEQQVKNNGPLSLNKVKKYFGQVLSAVEYYRGHHILHRDQNPSNILIGKDDSIKISDFGIACMDDQVDDEIALSVGGKATDPELVTGKKYDARSEIKGLAASLGYALTGRYAVQANPFTNTLTALDTGENLLEETGEINRTQLNSAYERYLASFPREAKPLIGILRKAFAGDYADVQDLSHDFNKTLKPTLVQRIKSSWKPILSTGLVALALVAGATSAYIGHNRQVQSLEEKAMKYNVTTDWDGVRNEIENNLIDLKEPFFYAKNGYDKGYPRNKLAQVKPGDTLDITILANEKPWPSPKEHQAQPSYPGRVYFEGFEGTNFWVSPDSFNKAYQAEYGTMGAASIYNFATPTNLQEGIRNLVIELYAPPERRKDESPTNDARKFLKFSKPGDVISRKVIPVQVGKCDTRVALSYLELSGYQEIMSFTEAGKSLGDSVYPKGINYTVEVPEEGYTENLDSKSPSSNSDYLHFSLPKGTNTDEATLIITAKQGTNEVYKTNVPVRRERIADGVFWWRASRPDNTFFKKVSNYQNRTH